MRNIAILATAYTLGTVRKHRKLKRNHDKLAELFLDATQAYEEEINSLKSQFNYLCDVLAENEIPVSEFDLIALNYYN